MSAFTESLAFTESIGGYADQALGKIERAALGGSHLIHCMFAFADEAASTVTVL